MRAEAMRMRILGWISSFVHTQMILMPLNISG